MTDEPTATEIGIPYARAIINYELQLVHICPICFERCVEGSDAEGEATTQNYGQHYISEHA